MVYIPVSLQKSLPRRALPIRKAQTFSAKLCRPTLGTPRGGSSQPACT